MLRILGIVTAAVASALAVPPASARGEASACLSAGDALEAVAEHGVVPPAEAIGRARRAAPGAEVLRALLCRQDDALVFRITMLRRDGRVLRVTVDARSGKLDVSP